MSNLFVNIRIGRYHLQIGWQWYRLGKRFVDLPRVQFVRNTNYEWLKDLYGSLPWFEVFTFFGLERYLKRGRHDA